MSLMDVLFWTLPFLLIFLVVREHPKDLGLFPDGAANAAETAEFGQGKRLLTTPMKSLGEIFLTPVFWVVIGSVFAAAGTIGTTLHILILYLRDLGFSQQVAASALSLEFAMSFAGRLGFGVLSDRFSARRVGVVSFMLLGLSSLLLFVARAPGMLIAFVILHGLGHGAIVSFFPLILAEAFGIQKHLGRLLAVGHLAYAGGLGTIPIISGYAFDSTGSFAIGFAINSITTWLACGGLVAIGLGGRTIERESSRS
jgi:MFS family permease